MELRHALVMQHFLFHCSEYIDALLIFKHVASCISVSTRSHCEVASLAAAWSSNLKCFIDFLPAHPGDLIANSPPPSPLIKRCTKDLSFRPFWEVVCTPRPSVSVITPDETLTLVIGDNLRSPFCPPVTVACLCGLFSDRPQLHSGKALQMQDDPVTSVWLPRLRNTFYTKLFWLSGGIFFFFFFFRCSAMLASGLYLRF